MLLSFFLLVTESPVLVIHQGPLNHSSQSPVWFSADLLLYSSGSSILTKELSTKVRCLWVLVKMEKKKKKPLIKDLRRKHKVYSVVVNTQCVHTILHVILAIYETGKLYVVLDTFNTENFYQNDSYSVCSSFSPLFPRTTRHVVYSPPGSVY